MEERKPVEGKGKVRGVGGWSVVGQVLTGLEWEKQGCGLQASWGISVICSTSPARKGISSEPESRPLDLARPQGTHGAEIHPCNLVSAGPRTGDVHLFLDTHGTCLPTSNQQKYLISIYWKPTALDKVPGPGDTFFFF